MKYKAKTLSIIIAAVLLIATLGACKPNKNPGSGSPALLNVKIVINSFNNYRRDFQILELFDNYGKVEMETDKKFIKEGEGSAKVTPLINPNFSNRNLRLVQYMHLVENGKYSDLSYADNIIVEVYNNSEKPYSIRLSATFNAVETDKESFELQPKKWNTVMFQIRDYHSLIYDLSKCETINFHFAKADEDFIPELYFDNLSVTFNENKDQTGLKMDLDSEELPDGRTAYEFCGFEKLYQQFIVQSYSSIAPAGLPTLSINKDLNYVDGYGKSLKVVTPTIEGSTVRYQGIEFIKALIEKSELNTARDDDTFSFKVYNASEHRSLIIVSFTINGKGRVYSEYKFYAEPNTWSEYKITFGKINENPPLGNSSQVDKIELHWESSASNQRIFYFDSFEIVKSAE